MSPCKNQDEMEMRMEKEGVKKIIRNGYPI
jgi:hypothetical protein